MRVKSLALGPFVLVILAAPGLAMGAGPSKEQCVSAYQGAQVDMKQSALSSAREKLALCLAESCPNALHSDCAEWLKEIDRRQPSVVLSFKGKDGTPSTSVPATVDGKPFAGKTDGRAVDVDPGEHTFVFSPPGEPPVDVRVVVREGEKSQKVDATSKLYVAPAREPREGPLSTPPPATSKERPVPWPVFALGGLGLVGAGGFVGFGIAGTRGKADLEDCKPTCTEDQLSPVRTKFIVADVSLAIGIVAVGVATVLFLTRPEIEVPKKEARAANAGTRVRFFGNGVVF